MIRSAKPVLYGCLMSICLLCTGAAAFAAAPAVSAPTEIEKAHGTIPIGLARTFKPGTVVSVMGSATVPSGTFSSSFGDEGFAIQDPSGGIYVSVADDLDVKLQDRVIVTGTLTESSGLLTLVPAADSDVTIAGRGYRVHPRWVRTGHVGPANQGFLINVVGIISGPIEPDPPYGNKIFVNDGSGDIRVFINTSADIDLTGLAPGQILSVTGFSSAFDTPEIDPRFQSDLKQPR